MKKIYIAGKVTGEDLEKTARKFKEAELKLTAMCFEAVNPIEVVNNSDTPWSDAMKTCIKAMLDCDGVVILPDWKLSQGARIERQIAYDLDIPIFNYDDFGLKILKAKLCSQQPTP